MNAQTAQRVRAFVQAWEEYKARTTLTVGLLADRRAGRIYRAANERAYAILAFLEVINRGCQGNKLMASLTKSMTPDGVIYFCHHEPGAPWKTVVFEIEMLPSAAGEHLELIVSTFVPFGAPGDPTHYPLEVGTEYCRGTQTLFPVVQVSASQFLRHSSLRESAEERLTGRGQSTEDSRRSGATFTTTHGNREQHTRTRGSEYGDNQYSGTFGTSGPNSHESRVKKEGWSTEHGSDARQEHQQSQGLDYTVMDRQNRDESSRHTERDNNDRITEIRYDVKFSAVGIDYSQSDRLFAAWRANAANARASLTIDYFLRCLSDFNDCLQERISQKVVDAREQPGQRLSGPELGEQFLEQARKLTVVEEGCISLKREVMALDGRARPIDPEAIRQLVQKAHNSLGANFAGSNPVLLVE